MLNGKGYRESEIANVYLRDNDSTDHNGTDIIHPNDIQISSPNNNHIYIVSTANNIYHVSYKNFMLNKKHG